MNLPSQPTIRTAPGIWDWLPLAVLPLMVAALAADLPAWLLSWALAGAIYAGLKWISFTHYATAARLSTARTIAYLFAWPGMDARAFFTEKPGSSPSPGQWAFAIAKTALGFTLVWGLAPVALHTNPLLSGWIGMMGIAFLLHFGIFHLLALVWQQAGIQARPLMNAPILACSVSDFWGGRWNVAFRDAFHTLVFRPLAAHHGTVCATWMVFLASGIVHDVVISWPAGAGYGWPTIYFLLQAAGVFVERSRVGRRFGLARGLRGRLFVLAITVLPAFWLFHPPFIERVVIPMLIAIGAVH